MPCKTLLALPLLGACVLSLMASLSPYACSSPAPPPAPVASLPQGPDVPTPPSGPNAAPEPPAPEACQPRTHTLTIYNGDQVLQQTFVWWHGSWRSCGDAHHHDACFREAPCSPWRCSGTYRSPCRAERAACSPRGTCNLPFVRHPCD